MEAVRTKHAENGGVLGMPGRLAGHGLRWTEHVRRAYWSAFRNGCGNTAKATAYSAIFAVFPALLVAAACVSLLPEMAPLRFELANFFNRVLPENVSPLLEEFFINADRSPQSTRVLIGAGLVGFSGAAGVIATLMEGFRRAYDLPLDAWSHWHRRLRAYLLVPVSLVPLTIASVLVVFGHYITLLVMGWKRPDVQTVFYVTANVVRWIVALSATAAVVASIYRFGTPKKLSWREVTPGATFATGTWFLSTLAFGWYVTRYADYSRVYGSLATGVVLMAWMFLTALSVLCGAELNAELARVEHHTSRKPQEIKAKQ